MKKLKLILVIGIFFLAAAVASPFIQLVQAGQTAVTISVTTPTDVVDGNDGLCSLREAVIAANSNAASGAAAGECVAGSNTQTDMIVLADGETYLLAIAGADEDNATTGDLDIADNTAVLDIQFTVTNNSSATIDADDIDRVLHIENAAVELNKIALVNGSASPGSNKIGGGIFNNNGIITMNGGEVRASNAVTGGGIYNYSSSPTGGQISLNGTQVILNGAGVVGGIFSGGDNALLMVDGAVVRANGANAYGGGLGISGGRLIVDDSTISLNTAQTNGGGIYADGGATITITNSLIEANEVSAGNGGGIYLEDADTQDNLTLQNSTIKDNIASGYGGGIYAKLDPQAGRITIQNNDFSGNQALGSGALSAPRATISGGSFDDNSATDDSGAIFVISLMITDTVFTNNSRFFAIFDSEAKLLYHFVTATIFYNPLDFV